MTHFTVGCNSVLYPSGFCGGGDGFAFLIHEKLDGDKDIGCYGGALGYGTITAADQGDDWARPRCLTYNSATAASKCDSGCQGPQTNFDISSVDANGEPETGNGKCGNRDGSDNRLLQDDGVFGEPCALMALCNPLDNGCGGTCGMPDCQRAIGRVVAVEFDTWNNLNLHDPKQGVSRWWINATEFVGYNDNHLAIFSSDSSIGTSTDHASPNHFAATPSIPNLADGKNHTVKIKYWPTLIDFGKELDGFYNRTNLKKRGHPHTSALATTGDREDTNTPTKYPAPDDCYRSELRNNKPGNFAVFIDDMKRPVLQTAISLRKSLGFDSKPCYDNDRDRCVLDDLGNAYIGFTASTGGERAGGRYDTTGSAVEGYTRTADVGAAAKASVTANEDADKMLGAAQNHEILSWKFCNQIGCVPI